VESKHASYSFLASDRKIASKRFCATLCNGQAQARTANLSLDRSTPAVERLKHVSQVCRCNPYAVVVHTDLYLGGAEPHSDEIGRYSNPAAVATVFHCIGDQVLQALGQ